jgi:glycosyltransferase involved in cell wall biosynthesis
MKIVQLVTQLEAGGAQHVASLLRNGLRHRGHDAELWFLYKKRAGSFESHDVHCLYPVRPHAWTVASIMRRLHREFLRADIDALVTHTHYANVLCQPVAAAAGIPVRIAVHHNPAATSPASARWLDYVLGATPVYTSAVCVSNVTRRSLARCPKPYLKKLTTILNGIQGSPQLRHYDIRSRWNIPENARVLVNVGRLARQKNQSLLLEAIALLPDVFLLIAGEGDLRGALLRQALSLGIENRVILTGELSRNEITQLIHNAEVFVLPSQWEAMPMVALEAMCAGRPIVASDIPALRETLGEAMEPFPPGDAFRLARAIRRLLDDPFRAAERAQNALQRSHAFSLDGMIQQYVAVIERAVQRSSTAARTVALHFPRLH